MIDLTNAYLFIVYGKSKKEYSEEFNKQQKQAIQNSQNQALQNINSSQLNIGDISKRLGMAVYTSPIVQNFASKNIPNSILSRLNSSLYDIMADGKISVQEVADDFIRTGTNVLDGTAIDLGYPTVSSLYNAIRPDGTGIFSKDADGTAMTFIKSFSKNSNKQNEALNKKENNKLSENNEVIKFKLVTEDSEKWNTNTPERRTESGLSLVPVLGNDNIEKTFSVSVVDNDKNGSMYDIKNKLYKLRQDKVSFDIYIVDDDVKHNYTLNNCVFTSISISTEGKNSLSIDMSIMQIPEYTVQKAVVSGISNSAGSGSSNSGGVNKKTGIKQGNSKSSPKVTNTSPKQVNIDKQSTCDDLNVASRQYRKNVEIAHDPNKSSAEKYKANQNISKLLVEGQKRINKNIKDPKQQLTLNEVSRVYKSGYVFSTGTRYTIYNLK